MNRRSARWLLAGVGVLLLGLPGCGKIQRYEGGYAIIPEPQGDAPVRHLWLDENGNWHLRSEISHGRIRCASYEVGVQLGKGVPACNNFQWLTRVDWLPRVRHCNSATRIHTGGGNFADIKAVEAASCARVVVRCEGC